MSDYDFSWWDAFLQGRAADMTTYRAVVESLLQMECAQPRTADETRTAEEKGLAKAYDPHVMAYATFLSTAVALADNSLFTLEDVPEVAARAAELSVAQQTIGHGVGYPRDLTTEDRRAAAEEHARELLEAAILGRLEGWKRENEPDDVPRE